MSQRWKTMAFALCLLAPNALAQGPEAKDAPDTVASVAASYEKAQSDWLKAYRAAKPEERRKLRRPDIADWRKRMWGICEGRLAEKGSAEALIWIASRGAKGEELERALGALGTHHLQNAGIGKLAGRLNRDLSEPAERFLRLVLEKAKSEEAQGYARYALGKSMAQRASLSRRLASDKSLPEQYAKWYGEGTVHFVMQSNAKQLEKEAAVLLATCVKQDSKLVLYGRSIGQLAEGDLFELQNLTVGKIAPDIEGEDIDGMKFRLSDYKGKVVMLDFWGDW